MEQSRYEGLGRADYQGRMQPGVNEIRATKGERGSGLGWAVVYGIVQRHGGVIDIESKKGQGTTFTIAFPATTAAPAEAPGQVEKVEQPLRILIADDQEIICELIAEYLMSDGHKAVCAFDGVKALQEFRSGSFDLVITDQSMPGMNGEQLGAAIAECAPQTPVILLTAYVVSTPDDSYLRISTQFLPSRPQWKSWAQRSPG